MFHATERHFSNLIKISHELKEMPFRFATPCDLLNHKIYFPESFLHSDYLYAIKRNQSILRKKKREKIFYSYVNIFWFSLIRWALWNEEGIQDFLIVFTLQLYQVFIDRIFHSPRRGRRKEGESQDLMFSPHSIYSHFSQTTFLYIH